MAMLGATLEDLSQLAAKLSTTAGDVGATRDATLLLTTEVVDGVTGSATRAHQQITTEMDTLKLSVTDAVTQADSADWTGANADRFREAAMGFGEAMGAAEQTTAETFELFRTSVIAMAESLDLFVQSLSGSLTDAETSAGEMSRAVDDQYTNLDQVMNNGLSYK